MDCCFDVEKCSNAREGAFITATQRRRKGVQISRLLSSIEEPSGKNCAKKPAINMITYAQEERNNHVALSWWNLGSQ
jgi:hypothetical protein